MGCAISVVDLKKSFKLGGRTLDILNGVSFDAPAQGITAIIGPNACGKTTLLRILAGVVAPDQGRVEIDGADLYGNLQGLRKKIGFVTPAMNFHNKLTMDETLSYFEGIQGSSKSKIRPFIEGMGMAKVLDEKIEGFSEGQKMTLRVACALMKEPSVLLLDEVTSPLDTGRRGRLIAFLSKLAETTTILMIDHNPRVISSLADRFVLMRKNGTVMRTGDMTKFFEATSDLYRLTVRPHDSVHPDFWKSFGCEYAVGEDGRVSFKLKSREDTNRLMDEIAKYSGSVHSYEASVVTLADVYEEWIKRAEVNEGEGR